MIQKKRFFLPIFLGLGILTIEEIQNFIYMPFIVTPCFFVLFWNFPKIVCYANSKPQYYEDLFIDESKLPNYEVNPIIKKRYEHIFKWSLITTTSILAGALSDYWLYKTAYIKKAPLEIAGISGGIILLFRNANDIIGKIIMICLRKRITKEAELSVDNVSERGIKSAVWNNINTPPRPMTPQPISHRIEMVNLRERSETI